MKLFQKNRAYVDVDERDTESRQNDADMYYGFQGHQNNLPRYAFDEAFGNVNKNRYEKHPKQKQQSIGGLVRKLNCSASKKDDWDEENTRKVLITVNTAGKQNLKNRTVSFSDSSPSRYGMSARERQYSPGDIRRSRSCGVWPSPPHQNPIDARRSSQDLARRQRWKRGFALAGRGRDDTSSMGSRTTETSGTGYSDDYSSSDDWTETTDDSYSSPKYYHQNYRHTSSGGDCTSGQIAEDFGIFANLLLMDGYACFGTAAAITKETVGECRSHKP